MKKRCDGFTLIELMVVIVILGLLTVTLIVGYGGKGEEARQKLTRPLLKQVSDQISMFRIDHSQYPEHLNDLVFRPTYVDAEGWNPYLTERPLDGWDNELVFQVPGQDGFPFDVVSYGADGQPGGEGFDEDLWSHARRD